MNASFGVNHIVDLITILKVEGTLLVLFGFGLTTNKMINKWRPLTMAEERLEMTRERYKIYDYKICWISRQ